MVIEVAQVVQDFAIIMILASVMALIIIIQAQTTISYRLYYCRYHNRATHSTFQSNMAHGRSKSIR